jgi:hypothetical protein
MTARNFDNQLIGGDIVKGGRCRAPLSVFKPQILSGDARASFTVTSVAYAVTAFDFYKPYLVNMELVIPKEY